MTNPVELFKPSNSDHGEWFMKRFCYKCAKMPHSSSAANQCGIQMRTMCYSTDDPEYPMEWIYIDDNPICTAFKDREEFNAERRARRKPANQKLIASVCDDLFKS